MYVRGMLTSRPGTRRACPGRPARPRGPAPRSRSSGLIPLPSRRSSSRVSLSSAVPGSRPSAMGRGAAYHHIRLLDATGRPVDAPFLELEEELWSNDGMRFTLLFDPGRIKRGLKPREELGPVLGAGKSYTLVIDGAWPDAM